MHAMSTKYNVLYNGNLALDEGINELKTQYSDNFWQVLPVERMLPDQDLKIGEARQNNVHFARAEEKATKAIQKHSMNIGGTERNYQIDEAHLLLGQSRYYDKRYIPSLEALNYILYKYPNSSKINQVKVWREKVNVRLENDAIALKNLEGLIAEGKIEGQDLADAYAVIAQAYLNTDQMENGMKMLFNARELTKSREDEARYTYILGQLYEKRKEADSAYATYQYIVDMKRKSPRLYTIHARARQMAQFNPSTGDTLQFNEQMAKLMEDRENRPYLDVLHHQYGLHYEKLGNTKQAVKNYNSSLDHFGEDKYRMASNYRNMAEIFFNNAEYARAGIYYDSTMTHLDKRSREFRAIVKKRDNLEDVIKYEGIVAQRDSIINLYNMDEPQRVAYFEKHIEKVKAEDLARLQAEEEARKREENIARNQEVAAANAPKTIGTVSKDGTFYFYNPSTVSRGKSEFKRLWGNRVYEPNWPFKSPSAIDSKDPAIAAAGNEGEGKSEDVLDERYTTAYYIQQIPTDAKLMDSLQAERNFAYYQLGIIYKEKFKEYDLAADKLEKLLTFQPEERLVLPSHYNLFKIYELTDASKAEAKRQEIVRLFPDSRYAQILQSASETTAVVQTPEARFKELHLLFEQERYVELNQLLPEAIEQYNGEEIMPKFALLNARLQAKLKGVKAYRAALNEIALDYPNIAEGKTAEAMLRRDIPYLEGLGFNQTEAKSWKLIYHSTNMDEKRLKTLTDKLEKFAKERTSDQLTVSKDLYTVDSTFVVIHNIRTEENAKGIASVLKEFKEYKIQDVPFVVSAENYAVVQIHKNLNSYLANPTQQTAGVPTRLQAQIDSPIEERQFPAERAKKQMFNTTTGQAPVLGNAMPPGEPMDNPGGRPVRNGRNDLNQTQNTTRTPNNQSTVPTNSNPNPSMPPGSTR